MEYAINLIKNEIFVLTIILDNWESKQYPEAEKYRSDKLSQLKKALKILENE